MASFGFMRRAGHEAAAAATALAVYSDVAAPQLGSEHALDSPLSSADARGIVPLSPSEVQEASNQVFLRSTEEPAEYVFNPSTEVVDHHPDEGDGRVYPRLRRNQSLGGEVLAMGQRLAQHPRVQAIIMDDIARHYPRRRREVLPSTQGNERGLVHLVDMLDPEDELMQVPDWSGDAHIGVPLPLREYEELPERELGGMTREAEAAPLSVEEKEETKEATEPRCSCRSCCNLPEGDEVGKAGHCWNEIMKDYECGICFDVLVGVHVLDNCGHHFCGACMERWMGNTPQGECPVCREAVNKLVPVRIVDQLVEKAVGAAAPGAERTAWLKRSRSWESDARRRQEAADQARAASEAAAAARMAQRAASNSTGAADQGHGRDTPGVQQWRAWRQRNNDAGRGEAEDDDGNDHTSDGQPKTWYEVVLAVAVVLVATALYIRRR